MLAYKEKADRLYKEALSALAQREEAHQKAKFDPYGRMMPADWSNFQLEVEKEQAAWKAYFAARDLYRARTGRIE